MSNLPPGTLPAPGNIYIIPIIATLGLVVSLDLLGTGSQRFDQPFRTRALIASGYFICGVALLYTLLWMFRSGMSTIPGAIYPLFILLLALVAYITLSSLVLIIGSLSSRSLRLTLRAHWGLGILILFIAILLFLIQPVRANYPFVLAIVATPISSMLARWQDHRINGGGPQVSGVFSMPGGRPDSPSGPSEVTRVAGSTLQETFPQELADRYTDIRFIGLGGISRVFRATRIRDGEVIAIKIPIHFDDTAGKCFMKEIMSWQGLEHPNIVRIREVNILPIPYVEMEYIRGTLQDPKKPLPLFQAVAIMTGIAEGLAFAHERGIIHRDIKPQNILLTPEGVPKITDWGMSKVMGTCVIPTLTGFSLSYAAPEQVAPGRFGDTDQRTDIYQIGAVFYELLTGIVLHPGEDLVAVSTEIISRVPDPPSSHNPAAVPLDAIILRCLAISPADRYQSVQDLLKDLQRFRPGGSLTDDMFEES